jgi:prepilin-type N-terminal cleavage/methylation domain-containing protein
MINFLSPRKLKRLRFFKRRSTAGFTLLELLVAMIIGSLIVVALLTLVVQLTETNQKDAARSQVQQDMQAASDFIAQEMREAVFVYNGECLKGNGTPTATDFSNRCPGIINHIPPEMSQNGRTPVLAFWKTKKLPDKISKLCGAAAPDLNDQTKAATNPLVLAGVPCLAGNSYSLVVYALDTQNPSNLWSGKARLIRYELSQFRDNAATEGDQNTGYVNPLQDPKYKFQQWPYAFDKNNTVIDRQTVALATGVPGARNPGRPVIPTGDAPVLVDFVDDKKAGETLNDGGVATVVPTPNCEEFGEDAAGRTNALTPLAADNPPRGFYACVRGGGVVPTGGATTARAGQNQDVLFVLKGNVTGQGGFFKTGEANKERISPLQTRVLVRGVVEKP